MGILDWTKHAARYFLVESGGRGRESFSGEPLPMWWIVARKRLPTPLRPQCKATSIDKKLLARCLFLEEDFPCVSR
jgi:hypothetical protein